MQHVDGGLWRDRLDFAWVDAFNDSVWIYAAQLAAEAVRMGFAEIQYDYVRFPDEPESRLATAKFTARRPGETKRQGVHRNLQLLGERTRKLGVPFTIDVFGLTTSATTDMGIGQMWEDLVTTADVVLPMVYPSHYMRGVYNLKQPNAAPYKVIRRAMQDAIRRSATAGEDRRDPAVSPGLHPGSAPLHPGPRPGADPRLRGAGPPLLGAVEPPQRLRPRHLPSEERRAGCHNPALTVPPQAVFSDSH